MNDTLYRMYLEELESISPCGDEENALLQAAMAGDQSAKSRLIERNLKRVLGYAKEYENRGLLLDDLIQEANIALTVAVGSYGGGDFGELLESRVRTALEDAVRQQGEQERAGEEIAARVNVLGDVSRMMATELGREATVGELAERMKMTEDEIKEIMKVTLDALSVYGDGGEEEQG